MGLQLPRNVSGGQIGNGQERLDWQAMVAIVLWLGPVVVGRVEAAGDQAQDAQPPGARVASSVLPERLSADRRGVWFAVFAPEGKTLAAGGQDGILRLWSGDWQRPRITSQPARQLFRCGAIAPGGKTVATGCASGTVIIWDAASGQLLKRLKEHPGLIRSAAFSADGRRLIAGGEDRTLTVWETSQWKMVGSLKELPQSVLSVAAAPAPDSGLLAVAFGDPSSMRAPGGVRLFELDTLAERGELPKLKSTIWSVAFSPDGRTLATGTGTAGVLQLWDPLTRRRKATVPIPHQIRVVAFSPDGKTLVTAGALPRQPDGSREGVAQLVSLETLKPGALVGGHPDLIVSVAFSADGRHLATTSVTGPEILVWEIAKLSPLP
jgi:WD40 repeat protein